MSVVAVKELLYRKGIGIMTVQELITEINLESNEILDDSKEYIPYINAAIDYLSEVLVAIKDREVIKTISIDNDMVVPELFMDFIPKEAYPIRVVNGSFSTFSGKTVHDVSVALRKNHVKNFSDQIPFTELFVHYLVQMVSYLVKKKSLMIEYASFDKGFIEDLTQTIKAARGA